MKKQRFRVVRVEIIDIETETGITSDEVQQKLMLEAEENDGVTTEVIDPSDHESVAFEYVGKTNQIVVAELTI